MEISEAIKQGYLENKIVYLRPSPRKGKMVSDPTHVAYFMYDQASIHFVLPMEANRKVLVNPFKSLEERKFFEEQLDTDLNPFKKQGNFWHSFRVSLTKTPSFMHKGLKLDLSEPLDNLRYRVIKAQDIVAPSWEQRTDKPGYKFALVDEDYEEQKAYGELEQFEEIFTFYGTLKGHPKKMKDFLEVYLIDTKQNKEVPLEADSKFLQTEIKGIIDSDKVGFLRVAKDEDYEMKLFITKAVKAGAIEKHGVNSFSIPGETTKWGIQEMTRYLKKAKEETTDTYLRIDAQIKIAN